MPTTDWNVQAGGNATETIGGELQGLVDEATAAKEGAEAAQDAAEQGAEAAQDAAEQAQAFGTIYTQTDAELLTITIPAEVTVVQRMPSAAGQVAPQNLLTRWRRNASAGSEDFWTDATGATFTVAEITQGEIVSIMTTAVEALSEQVGTWSFADRAAALVWIGDNPTPRVGTLVQWGGVAVRYIGSGTVIADMPGYVPDGDARLEHWGGGAGASSAANWSAWQAAYAAGDALHFGPGFYSFGSNRLEVTKASFHMYGARNARTFLQFSAAASGLRVSPPDPGTATGFLSGFQMFDLTFVGAGVTATGLGVELIMCNGPVVERCSVQGFRNQWKVAGGQMGRFLSVTGFAPTGSVIADVSGTSVLHIGPHIRDDDSASPAYTHSFDLVNFSGGSEKNCEHTIRIGSGDGIQFGQGNVNFGRTSNFYLEPEADAPAGNITATTTGQLYFDGVGQATGTEYGILFGTTAFTGRVNNLRVSSGTFIGNYQKSAIYSRANSLIGLFIDGANLSGCNERVVDIEGVTGSSGSRITIGGAQVRNGTLGGVKIVGARVVQITGCTFSDNSGADGALYVGGAISELVVQGNSYVGNSADFTNAGSLRPRSDVIEGVSVPTITFGGGGVGITYSIQEATYSIIGNRVFANGLIALTNKGSSTGEMRFAFNLPAALNASGAAAVSVSFNNLAANSANQFVQGEILASSTQARISEIGTSGTDVRVPYTNANITNSSVIYVSANWPIS